MQRSHATGDVEPHAAGRNNTTSIGIECSHASNRESVAPMGVRHGEGRLNDSRQLGDIDDLFKDLVVHVPDQRFRCVDDPGNLHFTERFNPPFCFRFAKKPRSVHGSPVQPTKQEDQQQCVQRRQ